MTGNEILDLIMLGLLGLVFIAAIVSAVIYNPNYSIKQILRKPWLIFDLIKHGVDTIEENLDKAEDALKQIKDAKSEAKDLIEDIKDITKQKGDKDAN